MIPLGNWTWKLALALLAIATLFVVFWPLPDPPPPPEPIPAVKPIDLAPEFDEDSMLVYTVQEDDTAESIARLFVVPLDDLLSVNRIPLGGDVEPGQRVWIPPARVP